MSIPTDAISQKLSIGKDVDPKDSLEQKGTMSIGNEQYPVRQNQTHQTDKSLLPGNDDSLIDLRHESKDDIDDESAPEQTGKIRFSSLNFDTPEISKGWRFLTTPLAFLKSVAVGAAVGAGIGAGVGAATGPGAAAAALVGGAVGGAAGVGYGLGAAGREARTGELADQLVAGKGWKSQKAHGQRAITALNQGGFFEDEQIRTEAKENFAQVSDSEWRKLLHVPTHYRITSLYHKLKGTGPRIKDARDRQKIREALMLYVARHGKTGAAAYRARLLEMGSRNPESLQTEINMLKAGVLAKQVAATRSSTEMNQIIQRNPEVFAHPQADVGLHTGHEYNELRQLRGLQAIFGVVDRLDAQGGVTQADREDLINAFKTAGVDNPPDILEQHVGKPMTPALRHKIVEAFRDHIILGQQLINPSIDDDTDPAEARKRFVDEIASKGYKDATTEQERQTRSKQEMQVIRDKVDELCRAEYNDVDEFSSKSRMEKHLQALGRAFETPAQEEHRLLQHQGQQPIGQWDTPTQQFQRFEKYYNEFAPGHGNSPGGDAFGAIQHEIGLSDDDLKDEQRSTGIRNAILEQFRDRWGDNGEKLPKPGASDAELRRDMKAAVLKGIAKYFLENPNSFGDNPDMWEDKGRAKKLKAAASEAYDNSESKRISTLTDEHYALQNASLNPLPDEVNANHGHNIAAIMNELGLRRTDLPSTFSITRKKIKDAIADQVTQNKGSAEIHAAVAKVIVDEALAISQSDQASPEQRQRATDAETRYQQRYGAED